MHSVPPQPPSIASAQIMRDGGMARSSHVVMMLFVGAFVVRHARASPLPHSAPSPPPLPLSPSPPPPPSLGSWGSWAFCPDNQPITRASQVYQSSSKSNGGPGLRDTIRFNCGGEGEFTLISSEIAVFFGETGGDGLECPGGSFFDGFEQRSIGSSGEDGSVALTCPGDEEADVWQLTPGNANDSPPSLPFGCTDERMHLGFRWRL